MLPALQPSRPKLPQQDQRPNYAQQQQRRAYEPPSPYVCLHPPRMYSPPANPVQQIRPRSQIEAMPPVDPAWGPRPEYCLNCRTSKTICLTDGRGFPCERCVKYGNECVYATAPIPRTPAHVQLFPSRTLYDSAVRHPVFFTESLRKPPFPIPAMGSHGFSPVAMGYINETRKMGMNNGLKTKL